MMNLRRLEISGFKSFAKKTTFDFTSSVVAIVGPNGSGKSNVAEAVRFVLGEQSMKSMRGKRGEDMIWNGSNQVPRMSRAGVALTFDNSTKFLDVDFDEVTVERVVHRDGANEYKMNGSMVRLKDIVEMLARANIGQTGHHIISQGEADKILSATPRDRKEMLEDALGLKVFQYKKEEAVRKLGKTEENMRQVEALRREVAPHLRFLKRQVDKLEKAEELRQEATSRYRAYFSNESAYVSNTTAALDKERKETEKKLTALAQKVKAARETLSKNADSEHSKELVSLSEALDRLRDKRARAAQDAARIAGKLEALAAAAEDERVPRSALERVIRAHEAAASQSATVGELQSLLKRVFEDIRALFSAGSPKETETGELQKQQDALKGEEATLAKEEDATRAKLEALRVELDEARTEEREQERALFTLTAEEKELRHRIELVDTKLETVRADEAELKRELGEVAALVGRAAAEFDEKNAEETERATQEEEKRALQKIKIRLEEMGAAGGDDVMKEYREVTDREAHLEKELGDLKGSAESLRQLIGELEEELSTRFGEGITAINEEFSRFFGLMFDGGAAKLVLTKEVVRRPRLLDEDDVGTEDDENTREKAVEGIDLSLSIPRKRIKSLVMLSGGERALTSIALIFAMSSVNPPPFLVLDETDAALDEANSRRYGDMVEALSKKSQLVLITHNRETMSRAGVLYGVTMGDDGVSKVLSVKLEEAVKVAK